MKNRSSAHGSFSVRRFLERDLAQAVDIIEEHDLFKDYGLHGERATRTLGAGLSDPGSDLWILEDGQGPVAFAWVVKRGAFGRAYLKLISVSQRVARAGAGKMLIHHIEATLAAKRGLMLLCTDSNVSAHGFYESLGYQAVGKLENFAAPGLDERIYWKPNKTTD